MGEIPDLTLTITLARARAGSRIVCVSASSAVQLDRVTRYLQRPSRRRVTCSTARRRSCPADPDVIVAVPGGRYPYGLPSRQPTRLRPVPFSAKRWPDWTGSCRCRASRRLPLSGLTAADLFAGGEVSRA